MGMDVYGLHPRDSRGEYFRNNVWWWHPLWTLCCEVDPQGAGEVENGHTNDGDGLDELGAVKLAGLLTDWLEQGKVDRYIQERQVFLNALPLEECSLCHGTGTRHDGLSIGKSEADFTCNACDGRGKRENFQLNYHLTKENVEEFRDFLSSCGGFEIC